MGLNSNNTEDLKKFLINNNVQDGQVLFVTNMYDYMREVTTRPLYSKEQQACLDAYAVEMGQARRRFVRNIFILTLVGAYVEAKIEMQDAYENRENCMAHAQ